jgi:hypothetical protein
VGWDEVAFEPTSPSPLRVLNHAVKRNIRRFPEDFMFQLNSAEAERLVSQNVIPLPQGQFDPNSELTGENP